MAHAHYVREWPRGPFGYPNEQRRNATIRQPAIPTEQSAADELVCSSRTLRRWRQQAAATGSPDRRGVRGGRRLKLSRRGAYVLYWLKTIAPEATHLECDSAMQFLCGEHMSQSQWSKELARLGFTRKKLAHLSRRRDESQRVSWWTSPPMAPP
jgi:transposase